MGSLPVSSGNFNRDLIVNSLGLNVLVALYGAHSSAAPLGATVPEPASLATLAIAAILKRKRRV